MRSSSLLLLALLIAVSPLQAQDSLRLTAEEFRYADNPRVTFLGNRPKRETDLDLWPTVGMAVAYGGLFTFFHFNQANAWWRDPSGEFKVIEDIDYARGLDKFGHAYSGYLMTTLCGDMLMESGFTKESSTWIGAGMGLAYMTYVEVSDGYASNWGFSPSDAYANIAGVSFYVLQNYVPFLENFTPRWSYIPPSWTGDADINNRPKTFIDDYNGTTFWLACNVNNLLPQSADPYWPDWMMVSVGYGIRNYAIYDDQGQPLTVNRRFLIGLDYDWVKILPDAQFGFFNYLRQFLNYIRLPGPTLEIGDEGVSFGLLYPFAIVVPL